MEFPGINSGFQFEKSCECVFFNKVCGVLYGGAKKIRRKTNCMFNNTTHTKNWIPVENTIKKQLTGILSQSQGSIESKNVCL